MKTTHYALVCALLLGSMVALAQTITPPALKSRTDPNELIPTTAVAPDAAVITIKGLCERPANSSATPSDCSTVITRAEFEKILSAVGPNMPPAQKKQFASRYVTALMLAEKAHELGLDQGPEFDEQMYLARLQVLDRQAAQRLQKDAANIPESEIGDYYQQHAAEYKTISFERIYVPKQKQIEASAQKPAAGADLQKQREATEAEMKAEADKLRARAASGEDFAKLQQEAYDFAGSKMKATNVKMEKVRKNSLPGTDVSIFDLKKDEVSQVFSDPTGYRIYKVREVTDPALASLHDEIVRALQGTKVKNAFDSLDKSATATYDDKYFAPPPAPSLKTPGASPAAVESAPHPAPGKK
ncbi:MAG: peptidyl-prolyl cis-trans isomerase [Acidobacteria bacterium]|nr:peptidyl-prolyl cis-trans isomerase [Acidobacteriota bacterium]